MRRSFNLPKMIVFKATSICNWVPMTSYRSDHSRPYNNENCARTTGLYPGLNFDSSNRTPPPPFSSAVEEMEPPEVRSAREHSFATNQTDMEKGHPRESEKKRSWSVTAVLYVLGWILLGCIIGFALGEIRSFCSERCKVPRENKRLIDPDTVDLSRYFRKVPPS